MHIINVLKTQAPKTFKKLNNHIGLYFKTEEELQILPHEQIQDFLLEFCIQMNTVVFVYDYKDKSIENLDTVIINSFAVCESKII